MRFSIFRVKNEVSVAKIETHSTPESDDPVFSNLGSFFLKLRVRKCMVFDVSEFSILLLAAALPP